MAEQTKVWEIFAPLAGGHIPVTELVYDKTEEVYHVRSLRSGAPGRIPRGAIVIIWEFESVEEYQSALKGVGRKIETLQ